VFEYGQEEDSLALQPELFVVLLEYLAPQDMSIGALLFGQFTCLSENFNEVAFELLYLLKVTFNVGRNVLEVP
jgi:hypothetical protein